MKKFIAFGFVIAAIALFASVYQRNFAGKNLAPQIINKTVSPSEKPARTAIVAKNLDIPWALATMPASPAGGPNNDILFTQRTGELMLISQGQISEVEKITDVKVYGEGGLMGLTLHPNFNSNHYIYLDYTYSGNGNNTKNRVVRYKFENNKLSDRKIIVDNIPGAIYHNGGRIKFGPDGLLYITTGDSLEPSLAQNKNSLAGKILRVTDDGKIPSDSPFSNMVYSYGHRNPQGLAWDSQGRLWATEHGKSNPGAYDEVNLIVKGANYGWPTIEGSKTKSGMQTPFVNSGQEVWAPAGAVFWNGNLYFGGLRGNALFELRIENGNGIIIKHLLSEFGRIRDVVLGPDNLLYITTSNRDGRGDPINEDDRIIKVDPSQL